MIALGLITTISLFAQSLVFTPIKPSAEWMSKSYDATKWKTASNWEELSKYVKGEVWIRIVQTFPIKELNNLVILGELKGDLQTFINGEKGTFIHSTDAKTDTFPINGHGIEGFAVPDQPTVFAWHYLPIENQEPYFAAQLKALPLDYLEENTPTSKYVVMEGENYMRDTQVSVGRDGKYYMTGTSGTYEFMFRKEKGTDGKEHQWLFNKGIQVYVSDDLKKWKSMGYVWQFDRDAKWANEIGKRDGVAARAVYAPEIHYFKKRDKYYIVYGPNTKRKDGSAYGIGILEAQEPQGPYKEITVDRPICSAFDGTLFEDDDGTAYLLRQSGLIMKLTDNLRAIDGEARMLKPANYPRVGFEGVYLFKRNGIYYLTMADMVVYKNGFFSYTTAVAQASNIYGPYSDRYFAFPSAGYGSIFQAKDGQWYSSTFMLPGKEMYPGIFPVEFDKTDRLTLSKSIGVPFCDEIKRVNKLDPARENVPKSIGIPFRKE